MYQLKDFKLPDNFRGKPGWYVQLWWLTQSLFFKTSPQVLYGWRRFLLSLFGAKIGKKVIVRPSAQITYPWKVTIGKNSWIGEETILYSLGDIFIGENVAIAHGVYFNTGLHDHTRKDFKIASKNIIIEDECWITNDVYIAPGVSISKGCVIGARSSVYKNMPEGFICYGNPAKPIKKRIEEDNNYNRN